MPETTITVESLREMLNQGQPVTVLDVRHAGHLSRARNLAERAEAVLHLPVQDRATFPFDPVQDNDEFAMLAKVSRSVDPLHLPEEAFVETILARIPPTPPNHRRIVELNEAGLWPDEDPTTLEAGANRCAAA